MNNDQQLALRKLNRSKSLNLSSLPYIANRHPVRAECNVGLQPLIWSWKLAEQAQIRADELAAFNAKSSDVMSTVSNTQGESLSGFSSKMTRTPLEHAIEGWLQQTPMYYNSDAAIRMRGKEPSDYNDYTQVSCPNTRCQ